MTRRLLSDVARCARDDCPLPCARKCNGVSLRYQTHAAFPGGDDCPGFIRDRVLEDEQ